MHFRCQPGPIKSPADSSVSPSPGLHFRITEMKTELPSSLPFFSHLLSSSQHPHCQHNMELPSSNPHRHLKPNAMRWYKHIKRHGFRCCGTRFNAVRDVLQHISDAHDKTSPPNLRDGLCRSRNCAGFPECRPEHPSPTLPPSPPPLTTTSGPMEHNHHELSNIANLPRLSRPRRVHLPNQIAHNDESPPFPPLPPPSLPPPDKTTTPPSIQPLATGVTVDPFQRREQQLQSLWKNVCHTFKQRVKNPWIMTCVIVALGTTGLFVWGFWALAERETGKY